MCFEVIQKVGKHHYIYLAESYRDKRGKPRQNRIPIGKIDLKTGRKIYKPEFLEKLKAGKSFRGMRIQGKMLELLEEKISQKSR